MTSPSATEATVRRESGRHRVLHFATHGLLNDLSPMRSQLVLASRLAALAAPIDGVTTSLDDAERIRRDARAARRLGFGAKLCIHPKQIAAVQAAFTPTEAELDWARRVLPRQTPFAITALD
mgnify:CR=1 FL=1